MKHKTWEEIQTKRIQNGIFGLMVGHLSRNQNQVDCYFGIQLQVKFTVYIV